MRATVRLADGSTVEGELVSLVYPYGYSNTCAAVPGFGGTVFVGANGPVGWKPPSVAVCAANPTVFATYSIPGR